MVKGKIDRTAKSEKKQREGNFRNSEQLEQRYKEGGSGRSVWTNNRRLSRVLYGK